MEQPLKYSLVSIPADKLLHFIKLDDLKGAVGAAKYQGIQAQLQGAGLKATSKNIKEILKDDADFIQQLRQSALGRLAFDKWANNYLRMIAPEMKAKRTAVRKEMVQPRKGFTGCIATKVDPADFRVCAETYDDPEYQNIKLIPYQALKQSAFTKTGNPVLAPGKGHISDLPRGLRAYYLQYPADYEEYLNQRKVEIKFLKAARQSAREGGPRPMPPQLLVEPVEGIEELPATTQVKRRR